MAAPEAPPEPLSPDVAGRLAEFAKACKAATRIVSMYPATHPAIQSALARIGEATKQATMNGPFAITVLPDALLVEGRGLAKPESSATELAVLLHQQAIGEMTLFDRLDNDGWHAFLSLIAKSPEDARALGGVAKAWDETGNKAITLSEIDYAEVLRERSGTGESASWDRILAALKDDNAEHGRPGGATMQTMLDLAESPERLAEFANRLQNVGKASGDDSIQQRKALLEMMHGLANYAAERKPEELDAVLDRMAGAAAQMSPDMLLTLITDPPPLPGGSGPRMDLAGELQARLTDEMLTKFLVDNVVKDRGASSRLATAFQTLVPDPEKQKDILAAAAEQAAALFKDDPQFESVWTSSTEMLMSYSDAKFVSEGYARELTTAQTQAMDVDKIGDDPPVRIRAWLSTVSDTEVRALDQQLILDLLKIEARPDAWAGVLDTAITSIDQLVLVGDLPLAVTLLESVVAISKDEASPFKASAAAGVTKLVEGPMVRHMTIFLQKATDTEFAVAKRMCTMIGSSLVKPMSDALMGEVNARIVRRLRDILVSFGPAAREYANELKSSRNPAVRRAAIDLLRGIAGDAALPELRQMLDDADTQVQREALRAIVQVGTREAYQMLEKALKSGAAHTQDAIMQSLGAFRDEKAAPLFLHILAETDYKGPNEGVYIQMIESLGKVALDDRSAEALKEILYRGEWWARGRTARIRTAAARALRSMGTPGADRALEEAATSGPGGARRVVRAVLTEPAPPRRRKDQAVTTETAVGDGMTVESLTGGAVLSDTVTSDVATDDTLLSELAAIDAATSGAMVSDIVTVDAVTSDAVTSNAVISDAVSGDVATTDTTTSDTVLSDTVVSDTATSDAATSDAVSDDVATTDATTSDTVVSETVISETVVSETVVSDAVVSDAVVSDAVVSDTVVSDTVISDTVISDTVISDTVISDTVISDTVISDTVISDTVTSDTVTSHVVADEAAISDAAALFEAAIREAVSGDAATTNTATADAATIEPAKPESAPGEDTK